MVFVHTEKGSDNVEWSKALEILKSLEIKYSGRTVVLNLYKNQTAIL